MGGYKIINEIVNLFHNNIFFSFSKEKNNLLQFSIKGKVVLLITLQTKLLRFPGQKYQIRWIKTLTKEMHVRLFYKTCPFSKVQYDIDKLKCNTNIGISVVFYIALIKEEKGFF